jgi:hypothetical protein
MATAEAEAEETFLRDHLWQQVFRPRGVREALPLLLTLVGALAVAALLWWAGVFGPRLLAVPLGYEVDRAAGTVRLDVRLTNRGLVGARPSSLVESQGIEVRAVSPPSDWSPRAFREFWLSGGESRRVALTLSLPCLADPAERWSLRMVGYGPTGGTEVMVPFARPGGDLAAWQRALVEDADCAEEQVRAARLAGSPLDAEGRPLALANGQPLPDVPAEVAAAAPAPVVVTVRVDRLPGAVDRCPTELTGRDLLAGWITPGGLTLTFAGQAEGWAQGEGAGGAPVVRETCQARWDRGAWASAGGSASLAADPPTLPRW